MRMLIAVAVLSLCLSPAFAQKDQTKNREQKKPSTQMHVCSNLRSRDCRRLKRPASAMLYNDARESTARPLPLTQINERPIQHRDSSDRPAADYLFCWVSTEAGI